MTVRLEASSGRIAVRLPYFVEKSVPVNGVKSLVDHQVGFQRAARFKKHSRQTLLVTAGDRFSSFDKSLE